MLIVSQHCDWMESHEAAEAIYHLTFDLHLSSLGACAGWVEWADCMGYQLSTLRLSTPPPPFNHIQTKHTHQMLACRYKDTHGCLHTNTYTQTDTLCSRGQTALHISSNTITVLLPASDSKLRCVSCFVWLQTCQLGYIRLMCVCMCLKQFKGTCV